MASVSRSIRKTREVCVLVIDANLLVRDFWWEGRGPKYLLSRLFLMHTLVVPELALIEAVAAIERRAQDLLSRIGDRTPTPRLLAQYQRLFRKTDKDDEYAGALSQRYKQFVLDLVATHGGFIEPVPDVHLGTVIERSIKRTKPFSKGDKGFRDTLLWLGVLDLVKQYQRVSFVSENTTDFAGTQRGLHNDLEKEVAKVLPSHILFRYFPTLDEFIASMDENGGASAEAFCRAIMSDGYRGFDLRKWIEANLVQLVNQIELDEVGWTGMPYWAENPRLAELEDLVAIEICEQSALDNNQVEWFCCVAIVGVFQCSIFYSSWESVVHPSQVLWVDESDDMWTEIGVRSVGTFTLRLVFDLEAECVVSSDVVAIEHDFIAARSALQESKEDDLDE